MTNADAELKEALKKALNPEAVPPVASPTAATTTDQTDPASGGDTPPEPEPVETPKEGDPSAPKEPDPIPYNRFKEKVDEANMTKAERDELRAQNAKLISDLSTLTNAVAGGLKPTAQQQVTQRENIETLVQSGEMTREDADRFLRVLSAANVQRGDNPALSKLQQENEQLKTSIKKIESQLFGDKDAQERTATLSKYDGVVTETMLKERMKEMMQSTDPRRRELADKGSYDSIIKAEFFDAIVKAETEKVLKGKAAPAPKLTKGPAPAAPVKPATKEILYSPNDPQAFTSALKAAVRTKVNSGAE